MQTSTITVAVLPEPPAVEVKLLERELEWPTCRSSGAGGQYVNKTESAVQLKHLPTGITVRCEEARSQHANRETALAVLRSRIKSQKDGANQAARAADRRAQVGSGMRGDKRRTIRADGVTDHVLGKVMAFKLYVRGAWEWK